MKVRSKGGFIWALVLAVGIVFPLFAQQNGGTETVEGVWLCEAATIDGKPLPEATAKQLRLTMTKDRYKTERDGELLFDSVYTVDREMNPAHIDIVGTEGALKGKKAQGIYEIGEGSLKICYTMPGGVRPTAFVSKPGSGAFYLVLKRH